MYYVDKHKSAKRAAIFNDQPVCHYSPILNGIGTVLAQGLMELPNGTESRPMGESHPMTGLPGVSLQSFGHSPILFNYEKKAANHMQRLNKYILQETELIRNIFLTCNHVM